MSGPRPSRDDEPRAASGPGGRSREVLRTSFKRLNTVMVPMLASPLGAWVGSPVVGFMALLTTTGRRSGLPRRTPLNYAILDGGIYLLAGFGERTDWLDNLRADARVEVRLPGRTVVGDARVVTDPAEASRAALAVARNCGFALVFEGLNPLTVRDEALRTRLAGRPVVRVSVLPYGADASTGEAVDTVIAPTGHDPGGRLWLLPHVVLPVLSCAVLRSAARRVRFGSAARRER